MRTQYPPVGASRELAIGIYLSIPPIIFTLALPYARTCLTNNCCLIYLLIVYTYVSKTVFD